jgi:hypothetical protein
MRGRHHRLQEATLAGQPASQLVLSPDNVSLLRWPMLRAETVKDKRWERDNVCGGGVNVTIVCGAGYDRNVSLPGIAIMAGTPVCNIDQSW